MRGREENYPSEKSEALDEGGAQTPVIQAFLYFVSFWGGDRPQEKLQAGPWMKESEKSEGFPKARKHLWRKKFDNLEKEAAWRPDC